MSEETTQVQETQVPGPAATPEAELAAAIEQVFGPQDRPAQVEPEKPTEPAATEPAKELEQAAEPPKDPAQERVAARIAAAKRAELKAAQDRAELRRTQEQIDARQRELDAREAKIRLIEEDPVRFFEEYKADPEAFLKKLAGISAPEAVVEKRVATLEEELRKEREQRQRIETEAARREEAAKVEAGWKAASAEFVDHVAAKADAYPHLVEEFTDEEAVHEAYRSLAEVVGRDAQGQPITRAQAYYAQHGEYPDNDVIAEYLNERAKARIDARAKSAWRKRGEAAAPVPSQGRTLGDPNPVPPVKGTSPRTLTSRAASEKASPPKGWTQEAADEESLRILNEAFSRAG
jgi:hypothetical protein